MNERKTSLSIVKNTCNSSPSLPLTDRYFVMSLRKPLRTRRGGSGWDAEWGRLRRPRFRTRRGGGWAYTGRYFVMSVRKPLWTRRGGGWDEAGWGRLRQIGRA